MVFSGSSTANGDPAGMTNLNSAAEHRGLPRRRRALVAAGVAVIAVIAAGGGYAIARGTASSPASAAAPPPASASPGMSTGGGGSFSSPSLAQSIGRQVGTAMAGTAPQTVSLAQTRLLGDQVPAGASVDKASNMITFTGGSASFAVVAVPPGGPDMTFRIAGLTSPAIVVAPDTKVTVEFINGDTDEAHGWLVTAEEPPFSFGQSRTPAIDGAFSGLIGDPTASGQGARTFTFRAGPAGTYQYICPMPGHAQMGMHGAFVVR